MDNDDDSDNDDDCHGECYCAKPVRERSPDIVERSDLRLFGHRKSPIFVDDDWTQMPLESHIAALKEDATRKFKALPDSWVFCWGKNRPESALLCATTVAKGNFS